MKNIMRDLRQQNNFSQEELGDMLDVSRQTVISIETGKYNPSLDLAFKISLIFKLPIEKIFMYEEEKI